MFKNILSSLKKSSFWNEKFQKAWILPTLTRLKQNGHKSKGLFDKILFPTTFLKCHHLTVPLLATTENSRASLVITCHIKKKKKLMQDSIFTRTIGFLAGPWKLAGLVDAFFPSLYCATCGF